MTILRGLLTYFMVIVVIVLMSVLPTYAVAFVVIALPMTALIIGALYKERGESRK